MSASNYSAVMEEIFAHEGGFVNHPRDPGGATNMGITQATLSAWRGRPVTASEVATMSKDEARMIYRVKYWSKVKGDDLPDGLDLVAMDGGVNSGVSRGARWLQIGVGATPDGVVGAKTIEAAHRSGISSIERACAARMSFLRGLSTWGTFGRGWSRRVASVEATGTRMMLLAMGSGAADAGRVLNAKKDVARVDEANATKGIAGQGGTGAAAGGGLWAADMPSWVLVAVAAVSAVLVFRLVRKALYQRDLQGALSEQIKKIEVLL